MNLINGFRHKAVQVNKSMSEALILASTKPKYDNRLFIELQVQYEKTTSSVHVQGFKFLLQYQRLPTVTY